MGYAAPRFARSAVFAVFAVFAATALGTSPASAAYLHSSTPTASFGPDGTGSSSFPCCFPDNGLQLSESEDELYVHTEASGAPNAEISAFDLANPYVPLGSPFPLALPATQTFGFEHDGIAVDNSAQSSAGNLYYFNPKRLYGFDPSGAALPGFPVDLPEPFSPCGIAVDGHGNVWTYDQESGAIKEFDASGEQLGGSIQIFPTWSEACNLAFDRESDDLYAGVRISGGGGLVLRFSAADDYSTSSVIEIDPGRQAFNPRLAFDTESQELYVARGEWAGHPADISAYNADGELLDAFAEGLETSGIAVDEGTGDVFGFENGPSVRHVIKFPPSATLPAVTTEEPVGTTLKAHVDPLGAGNVTACEFEFGTTTDYGSSLPCDQSLPFSAPTGVTATLPSPTMEIPYYFRVRATNSGGAYVSAGRRFIPHYVQGLKTEPADGLTKTGATLNASYTGTGLDTHYYFEWGPTTAYGNVTAAVPGADDGLTSGPQTVTASISGLTQGTTYHYRVIASNSGGTSIAQDRTFVTLDAVTGLSASATNVTGAAATLNGFWSGDGTDTHYYFEWGFTPQYEHVSSAPPGVDAGAGTGPQHVTFDVPEVLATASYHFRVVASNSSGTTIGPDMKFRTPKLPLVGYLPVLELTTVSAELTGKVNPQETGATTYHFDYGPSASYGSSTPESGSVGSDEAFHPASAKVTGLSPGTTYHYRLVAMSAGGTVFGLDRTFTTVPNSPTIVGMSASDVSGFGARLSADVKPGFGPTVVFFQFGADIPYKSTTVPFDPLPADDSPHAISTVVSGLVPATLYHYRAVALNFAGSVYGEDRTFETAGLPQVLGGSALSVTQEGATLTTDVLPGGAPTTVRFEYGTGAGYETGASEVAVPGGTALQSASAAIVGLKPGTTYHYRAVANNSVGQAIGTDRSFTTEGIPANREQRPPKCHKGKVRRHGKCVRKHRRHRATHKHHGRRSG